MDASFYLRRDLSWVAKRTRKYTQVSKKKHLKADRTLFHWIIIGYWTSLRWLGWVAKRWKTCFDLRADLISTKVSASHRKSTQVHISPGKMEWQVDLGFQLASNCDCVWPGLKVVWSITKFSWLKFQEMYCNQYREYNLSIFAPKAIKSIIYMPQCCYWFWWNKLYEKKNDMKNRPLSLYA